MARTPLGKVLRAVRWIAGGMAIIIATFLLVAWAGSSIPRNSNWQEADESVDDAVTILIGSNGVHTEIAMPIVTPQMDWRSTFPASDIIATDRPYTHVAVSWGERAFFLETPTWADLNPLVAARALIGGEGIVHVAHYVRPAPSEDYRELRISRDDYAALAQVITAQLLPVSEREVIGGYGANDVFYSARGTYHLGNTCNQWTSDRLADAGIRIGRITPFAGGVMKWVPEFQAP